MKKINLISIVIFAFIIFSTIYSIFIYPNNYSEVMVTEPFAGYIDGDDKEYKDILPKDAFHVDEMTMSTYVFCITEETGAWGKEYHVAKVEVLIYPNYINTDTEYMPFAFFGDPPSTKVVISETELCNGERVRVDECLLSNYSSFSSYHG